MIHYHGTPTGGPRQDIVRFLRNRHALIPYFYQDDIGIAAEVCASFIMDNSAFTVWQRGGMLDVPGFTRWVERWSRHPGFDWALIPDVIDGDEPDNDALIRDWPISIPGVPVWHLHESLERLYCLAIHWPRVALGSSGAFAHPGSTMWWSRMAQVMRIICDDQGQPITRLHGLRMLNPSIFTRVPLASADSTNAVRNSRSIQRFGMYVPPSRWQRATVIADRIEMSNSCPVWTYGDVQLSCESGVCPIEDDRNIVGLTDGP